jgi:hypothetical protein
MFNKSKILKLLLITSSISSILLPGVALGLNGEQHRLISIAIRDIPGKYNISIANFLNAARDNTRNIRQLIVDEAIRLGRGNTVIDLNIARESFKVIFDLENWGQIPVVNNLGNNNQQGNNVNGVPGIPAVPGGQVVNNLGNNVNGVPVVNNLGNNNQQGNNVNGVPGIPAVPGGQGGQLVNNLQAQGNNNNVGNNNNGVPGGLAQGPVVVPAVPLIQQGNQVSAPKLPGIEELSNAISTHANNPKLRQEAIREIYNNGDEEVKDKIKEYGRLAVTDGALSQSLEKQSALYDTYLATLSEEEAAVLEKKVLSKLNDTSSTKLDLNEIVSRELDTRIDSLVHAPDLVEGIASGDEDSKWLHGVWISGLYGSSKQGKDKNIAGYNGRASGATIGADLEISEGTIVGLAYSHILSNYKYKQEKIGDKLDAKSHVVSLYGQKELNDQFSLRGILSYSNSSIKEKARKGDTGPVASGKFKSNAFSFESTLGYKILLDNDLMLVPNIGVRYGYYKDSAYKQKDSGTYNIHMNSHSDSSFTGILGAKLALSKQVSENTLIMPSIHSSIESYFNNKTKKVKARLEWSDKYLENDAGRGKQPKIGYNVGASLLAKHKNIEVLATYNLHARKKYQNHQGSLKLKLLF